VGRSPLQQVVFGEDGDVDTKLRPRTAFWRGLRLRCAWCGSRRTFVRRWLGKYPRCRTCGLEWRREEGFELGPVALNTVITFFCLTVGMGIGFVVSYPDIAVWPIIGWGVAIAVLLPILIYPLTFTVWFAFDVLAHPPEVAELAAASAYVAAAAAQPAVEGAP
jgi:uncharacterized protein (DUF983 family)